MCYFEIIDIKAEDRSTIIFENVLDVIPEEDENLLFLEADEEMFSSDDESECSNISDLAISELFKIGMTRSEITFNNSYFNDLFLKPVLVQGVVHKTCESNYPLICLDCFNGNNGYTTPTKVYMIFDPTEFKLNIDGDINYNSEHSMYFCDKCYKFLYTVEDDELKMMEDDIETIDSMFKTGEVNSYICFL